MRIVMFYHSLLSDWNHGNAHFLRGVASRTAGPRPRRRRLRAAGRLEPREPAAPSTALGPSARFRGRLPAAAQPALRPRPTRPRTRARRRRPGARPRVERPRAGRRLGGYRARGRRVTACSSTTRTTGRHRPGGDGGLRPGALRRRAGLRRRRPRPLPRARLGRRAWTWHEAADIARVPAARGPEPRGRPGLDRQLGRRGAHRRAARVPARAGRGSGPAGAGPRRPLSRRGRTRPWPSAASTTPAGCRTTRSPEVFARFRVTVHVPRRPYVEALPGIPTIRAFEALACGIPLVCAPWDDAEGLFTPGRGLPRRPRRPADGGPPPRPARRSGAGPRAGRARPRNDPAPHTCATASTSCWRSSAAWARRRPSTSRGPVDERPSATAT